MEPHMPMPDGQTASDLINPHSRTNMGLISGGAISVGALGYGFGDCAFDVDKADACVSHASGLIDTFYAMGMHIIEWAIAIGTAAFNQ
jgi:hypothetical protein